MFWTYILYSESFDKYYIGFTHDLQKRLIAHNHPKNKGYTRKYKPWRLVYSMAFNNKKEAMNHETHLKSLKSKNALVNMIMTNTE